MQENVRKPCKKEPANTEKYIPKEMTRSPMEII